MEEVRIMANEALSEKVSVNINTSTLSCIDLLVDNGYYSNRSDFINQALRDALQDHQSTLGLIISKKTSENSPQNQWFIGLSGITRGELMRMVDAGESIRITGYGVYRIDPNCPEDMLFKVIRSIDVRGKVLCTDSVRAHYGIKNAKRT